MTKPGNTGQNGGNMATDEQAGNGSGNRIWINDGTPTTVDALRLSAVAFAGLVDPSRLRIRPTAIDRLAIFDEEGKEVEVQELEAGDHLFGVLVEADDAER